MKGMIGTKKYTYYNCGDQDKWDHLNNVPTTTLLWRLGQMGPFEQCANYDIVDQHEGDDWDNKVYKL